MASTHSNFVLGFPLTAGTLEQTRNVDERHPCRRGRYPSTGSTVSSSDTSPSDASCVARSQLSYRLFAAAGCLVTFAAALAAPLTPAPSSSNTTSQPRTSKEDQAAVRRHLSAPTMSLSVGVPTLTQCETASISWAGPLGINKTVTGKPITVRAAGDEFSELIVSADSPAFVDGQNWFAEDLTADPTMNMAGVTGVISWVVDIPAGLSVAIEILNMRDTTQTSTSVSQIIQAGTSGSCLEKNQGVLSPDKMTTLYRSVLSASPTYFPYISIINATSGGTATGLITASATATSSRTTSYSTQALGSDNPYAPLSTSGSYGGATTKPSNKSTNAGAIAGGVVGGVALLSLLVFALLFCRRRRRPNPHHSLASTAVTDPDERSKNRLNPVEAWRALVGSGRPASEGVAYEPTSPDAPMSPGMEESGFSSPPTTTYIGGARAGHSYSGSLHGASAYTGVPEVQEEGTPLRGERSWSGSHTQSYSQSHSEHDSLAHGLESFQPRGVMPPEVMEEAGQREERMSVPDGFESFEPRGVASPELSEEWNGDSEERLVDGRVEAMSQLTSPGR
ncbi:hypothetical protein P7C70_g7757, partial [Phenoliferia sp. Uapishka_3]